ncbi:unnamed protein product [Ranitomeya imitator]|uniref:Transposase n=1 Tax=Ranitomeya imitator TaxID=111125 RepID=A0ABN9KT20_9NEOB|nr:unnamed protein product [Ranitomeya imitator]
MFRHLIHTLTHRSSLVEITLQQIMAHLDSIRKDMVILEKSEFATLRAENEKMKIEIGHVRQHLQNETNQIRADTKLDINLERSRLTDMFTEQEKKLMEASTEFHKKNMSTDGAITEINKKIDIDIASLKTLMESHKLDTIRYLAASWEIGQDIRKRIVDLHKSGSSFGTITRYLKVPRSSVQTIIHKYKQDGNVQSSYRSGRRRVLCPRDERALVRHVHINPRTKAKDLVKMMTEAGKIVSISTVKRVLYQHGLKGHSARKKPLLHKK